MLDFLKEFMRPSDLACMLTLLAPGVVLLFTPSRAWLGRRWVVAYIAFYLFLSSPIGARLLVRTLSAGYRPIATTAEAHGATVIVVLGAGSVNLRSGGRQLSSVTMEAGLRVLEAARLFQLLNRPLIIASGGITEHDADAAPESLALRRALIELGVSPERILLESTSKNTREEATIIKQMLTDRGVADFVLVTSPLHMRRSMLAFEREGLHPIPSPSALVPDRSRGRNWLMPSEQWLQLGDSAIYEWLARAYYWSRGWS
jgi:uncharacterized SAM-binding protein YcdF (DUF218 family)